MPPETNVPSASGRFLRLHFETALQEIIMLAAEVCNTPVAAFVFADQTPPWITGRTSVSGHSRIFPAVAGLQLEADLPHVPAYLRDAHNVRVSHNAGTAPYFYTGMPLADAAGANLGTLCVVDDQPRTFTREQVTILSLLSRQVRRLTVLASDSTNLPERDAQHRRIVAQSRSLRGLAAHLGQPRWTYPDIPVRQRQWPTSHGRA